MTLISATTTQTRDLEIAAARHQVYEHECALHDARRSNDDRWISAANDSLHDALTRLTALEATPPQPPAARESPSPAGEGDILTELTDLMGQLNLLALRATRIVEIDDTLCMTVGRHPEIRLTITRHHGRGRAPFTLHLFRVQNAGAVVVPLASATAAADELVDVLWDTVDGHL